MVSPSGEEPRPPLCQQIHHIASYDITTLVMLTCSCGCGLDVLLGYLSGARTLSHFSKLIRGRVCCGGSTLLKVDVKEVPVNKMNVADAALRIFL